MEESKQPSPAWKWCLQRQPVSIQQLRLLRDTLRINGCTQTSIAAYKSNLKKASLEVDFLR